MRSICTDRIGSVDDYRIVDAAAPKARRNSLLIRVGACGIGYVDALEALGGYQVKPTTPFIPGHEIAGVVEEIGEGVAGFSRGDRVVAITSGGCADLAVAPAASCALLPDGISFVDGASLLLNGLTVTHALRDRGFVQRGETVLVLGAAGGVGATAVQIAGILGARVIAAASTREKREFALTVGAEAALDSHLEGWRERLKAAAMGSLNVVFDPICGPMLEPTFRSLTWRGRHLVVGFLGGIPALPVNLPLMKGASLIGVDVRQYMQFEPAKAMDDLRTILAWASDGRLRPTVGQVFPMASFASAIQAAMSGNGLGKVVLEISTAP